MDPVAAGLILAVKGTGGFHLVCDASQPEAIAKLRARKRRRRKPFAVMVPDGETAAHYFHLSPTQREVLESTRAPIVLAKPRPQLAATLPLESLAPGYQRLGVMLPYTPLYAQLFSHRVRFLVVTSGNVSGLPMARTDTEARALLQGIADQFLLHPREIPVRVEDSICQVVDGRIHLIRRSRGFAWEPIPIPVPAGAPVVLGVGAQQQNTCCVVQEDQAILSPPHGDVDTAETLACWHEGIRHLTGLLPAEPKIIAYDPHPAYPVSQEAVRRWAGQIRIPVYHHHAHMAATMAEHGLTTPVIGCILDGTGYSRDGSLWGFEILVGDYVSFERIVHLEPMILPGGEAAIRAPWLLAVSLYYNTVTDVANTQAWVREFFPQHQEKLPLVLAQLGGRIPSPRASSAGRLFDGVAAMLGLCTTSTYQGEAAMLLGEQAEVGIAAEPEHLGAYPVIFNQGRWQTAPLIRHLLEDIRRSLPVPVIARKFHHTVAQMVCQGARHARERTGLQSVVLGGGVWQNRCLLRVAKAQLTQHGFTVYTPEQVPAGDGGIALGQAVSALWRWHQHVSCGTGQDP